MEFSARPSKFFNSTLQIFVLCYPNDFSLALNWCIVNRNACSTVNFLSFVCVSVCVCECVCVSLCVCECVCELCECEFV